VLTPERAVKHEHDYMQKLLVTGAPIGLTGCDYWFDRCARPLPPKGPRRGGSTLGRSSIGRTARSASKRRRDEGRQEIRVWKKDIRV
jgi:hypothetical protein